MDLVATAGHDIHPGYSSDHAALNSTLVHTAEDTEEAVLSLNFQLFLLLTMAKQTQSVFQLLATSQ